MSKKLYIKTYGCQMNVYDSVKIQDLLYPFGYESTEDIKEADIIILNTCHIREKAAEKTYSELGRIKKLQNTRKQEGLNPAIIVVAGCVAQAEGEVIFTRTPYVDIVVGPQSYYNLPELISKVVRHEKHLIDLDFVEEAKFDNLPEQLYTQGASSFISVQEGCDKFCTFCVVPYTRGAEFSRSVEQVYRESLKVVSNDTKEIILLGQNVNAYHGKGPKDKIFTLADLLKHLAQIPNLERLRYMTSHPIDMTDDLIKLHGTEPKLMPFLHLPVQSGSNKILKAMNRKHDRDYYFNIINRLREARSDIVLSSDFIVGFPGETEKDFEDTLDLVQRVKYGQCYSFKYSPRPGTPGAIRTDQIPEHIKSKRLTILQKELATQQLAFNESCVGSTMKVLFDRDGKFEDQIIGKTPYMQSVYIHNPNKSLLGKIVDVIITKAALNSLTGEIL
ncbi:tRNA (N6-isopentenyl adenosine(37)-C2)-methylthiotransferase MiaB [Rickettsia typhi]|uniref:tRNA-2-methylthio-N(6)-dimethylallyladenosine synthase n=2 Tax=Rickettsia typhi TaxID=785 RepID=MIAB_RICTY|nr:tRNA (N6-isopentenyl adenosine(37)-C2)-methylthiotransferase MiaB [Rickettsia typhi]Q68VU1.1 RecName: Full=tRNA-2-methylthio-N(6)-dimethylallyladenosine synthase; AltName: Full=(Dimethylallyl)adenosine tRNA methylthiotransferase MiaB; AltName: Full=tRNA-i(6)A37 methylthiotransferase [Rickettsia typhi str. Wilmington]AAU04251.1 tRNA-methylthiotransferase (MiaB protein) [Rickettsia typhi str. Wilmington]AFE54630.1 (dimethylallyl)adenosine tRNA methylthiotransferase [Rickettsia typhi str. TH1527